MNRLVLLLIIQLGLGAAAEAQHPLDVQRLTAQGRHLDAVVTWEKMAKRITTVDATIAAARSAWALSLPETAHDQFDEALRSNELSALHRASLTFAKAILFFQENRFELATVWGEKAQTLCPPSATGLRARIFGLLGEAELELERVASAEQHLSAALKFAASADAPELAFHLARARIRLGKLDDARAALEQIPLSHERAPEAIRALAVVAARQRDLPRVGFWLTQGRQEFPDKFLDGWVDYMLMESAISAADVGRVRELREAMAQRLPPSDHWRVLSEASAEAFEWDAGVRARLSTIASPAKGSVHE